MIDEAGARVHLKSMTRPPDLKEIDEEVEKLNKEKEEAVANQDFEKAAALRDQADKLKKKKQLITHDWREKSRETDGVVDEEVIAEVVSKITGVPLTRMTPEDSMRLDEDGGGIAQARRQPGRGDQVDQQGGPPQPQRPERPASGPPAASSSPGRPAWARRCWPRRWPSSCSATPTR